MRRKRKLTAILLSALITLMYVPVSFAGEVTDDNTELITSKASEEFEGTTSPDTENNDVASDTNTETEVEDVNEVNSDTELEAMKLMATPLNVVNESSVTHEGVVQEYATFEKAVAAAQNGDLITMLENADVTSVSIDGLTVTIDLNGKTITGTSTYTIGILATADVTIKDSGIGGKVVNTTEGNDVIAVKNNATFTLESGTLYTNKATSSGIYCYTVGSDKHVNIKGGTVQSAAYVAIVVYGSGTANGTEITCSLNISGGNITGYYGAVFGNGTAHGTQIDISGSPSLTGTKGVGIYHPQRGILNISGGTITGTGTGIEMRAGSLNLSGNASVSGGTTADDFGTRASGSGNTTSGVGVALAQHTTKLKVEANISGGTVKGYYAFYEHNPQGNSLTDIEKVTASLSGGNFESFSGKGTLYSEDLKHYISGGTYSENPTIYDDTATKYLNLGFVSTYNGSKYLVGKASNSSVGSNEAKADIATSVTGSTATVTECIIPSESDLKRAVIDLSTLGTDVKTVSISPDKLRDIKQNANGLKIILSDGYIVDMDKMALESVLDDIGDSIEAVTLSIKGIASSDSSLTSSQLGRLKDLTNNGYKLNIIDAELKCGSKVLGGTFGGGTVQVTIPFTRQISGGTAEGYYLSDNGSLDSISVDFTSDSAIISMKHFSKYVITEKASTSGGTSPKTGDSNRGMDFAAWLFVDAATFLVIKWILRRKRESSF